MLAFEAGFALVMAAILCFFWWSARPVKSKPWNRSALVASYDYVDLTDERYFRLRYIVNNQTDSDYTISDSNLLHVEAKTADGALHSCKDCVELQTPVFIPAHESASVVITLKYEYLDAKSNLSDEGYAQQRKAEATYLTNKMPRLNGFALHDERTRYEVTFLPGWKQG